MIEFKIKGHILRLTNAEWKNLKKRFDPKNAVLAGWTYSIKISCKLCARYKKKARCSGCPFYVLFSCNNACLELIQLMFPAQKFIVNIRKIYWSSSDNYNARRQLNSLQRRMKRIEEAQ